MIRYSFKKVIGQHFCWYCGELNGIGIETDRQTGEDYHVCKNHVHSLTKIRRTALHLDFRHKSHKKTKNEILSELIKGNKQQMPILGGLSA